MTGGKSEPPPPPPPPPPVNGGEFLLQLLKNPSHNHHHHHHHAPQQQLIPPQPPPTTQILTSDPAVAAFGPTLPGSSSQLFNGPAPPWYRPLHQSPPPFAPHNFFLQTPNPDSNFPSAPPPGFNQGIFRQHNIQLNHNPFGEDVRKLGILGNNFSSSSAHSLDSKDLIFGSLRCNDALIDKNFSNQSKFGVSLLDERREMGPRKIEGSNGYEVEIQQTSIDRDRNPRVNFSGLRGYGNVRSDTQSRKKGFESDGEKVRNDFGKLRHPSGKDEMELSKSGGNSGDYLDDRGLSIQLDRPGPPPGSTLHSVSASEIENSMMVCCGENGENEKEFGNERERIKGDVHSGHGDLDDLEEQLVDSLGLGDESDEKNDKKKPHGSRDKEYRSDKRGKWLLGQRMRYLKRQVACPGDIDALNVPFLTIFESLIPPEEEKAKQKQLLTLLENIVRKEWPEARLYIYGSCANSFGFSKSDIDICLTINDVDINKAEVLLKLADMLQLENLQNVQALTRARVPIVKLMDPATGISCDICINNVLAVVNTKLLHDYAQIDARLRQLAFIVKHWAKSRGVNETYQGTLSSYAYVLMCIHFLQQRRPAILPCLQGMKTTYSVTVDNVECSYFDQVENLVGFGSHNRETIAKLVWAFFRYWAYCHDYANDVVSVRAGTVLSKRTKDWTRRIGNDRHLICIEDPFEISHDLGRVVDKHSIRVLREEFERAAEILQYDPNPCVKLFEPYVPT